MAIKYKQDKNNEFLSVDRDIREHELEGSDFDLMLTDSTCPFKALIDEIMQPGEEYYFAYNNGFYCISGPNWQWTTNYAL
jgi:hypothetical protein